jgi:nitrate reductase delta subunit
MMTNDRTTVFKLLSLCLAYPDPALAEALPDIESAAAGLSDARLREGMASFAAALRSQPLLSVQEHYIAVFDMTPAASLNLTYHLMGDREERGRALAELLAVYRMGGFEPAVNELPDYLPLLLEFLACSPQSETFSAVQRCLGAVPAITGRLREIGSLYAAPFELLGRAVAAAADSPPPPSGASGV